MSTIWVSFSGQWRNPALEKTLFGPVCRLGWLTLGLSRYELTGWLSSWHGMLLASLKNDDKAGKKGQQS